MSSEADPIRITLPMTPDEARKLRVGQRVLAEGHATMTVGFSTHKRMVAAIEAGTPMPVDLEGGSLFHMGSCCYDRDGRFFPHYVNPSTSTRFDAFMPTIVRGLGLTAVGGKGGVGEEVVATMKELGCVYLAMPGGAAPLLSEGAVERLETGWDDLIEQFRLSRFRLDGFGPLVVGVDAHGNSLYRDLSDRAEAKLPAIMARLAARREVAGKPTGGK